MSKTQHDDDAYEKDLEKLQIALIHSQRWAMEKGKQLVVIFEGRDAAGKDGTIARIVQHLSKRNARVVALPKPSDRQATWWWFQRYVEHLPAAGEWVLFNRSWYNRAGVEVVMGFSTPEQQEEFLRNAPDFERLLTESNIQIVKYWLDISKKEQDERLERRKEDPLRSMKTSPLDVEAQKRWKDYSKARDEMLLRTHSAVTPWTCVRADHKKKARLNVIRHLLHAINCPKVAHDVDLPDPDVVFEFEKAALKDGRLEP
ncbi:MAG TPA: polyphosphate kinase 2 [Caulobacteraceae bacterium]|jgi:polyphosphate kinase 2